MWICKLRQRPVALRECFDPRFHWRRAASRSTFLRPAYALRDDALEVSERERETSRTRMRPNETLLRWWWWWWWASSSSRRLFTPRLSHSEECDCSVEWIMEWFKCLEKYWRESKMRNSVVFPLNYLNNSLKVLKLKIVIFSNKIAKF